MLYVKAVSHIGGSSHLAWEGIIVYLASTSTSPFVLLEEVCFSSSQTNLDGCKCWDVEAVFCPQRGCMWFLSFLVSYLIVSQLEESLTIELKRFHWGKKMLHLGILRCHAISRTWHQEKGNSRQNLRKYSYSRKKTQNCFWVVWKSIHITVFSDHL